jgi:chromosome segregation ATPase
LAEKVKDLKVEFQLTLENHNGMVKELDTVKLEYERILNRLVLLKAQAKTHVEKIRDEKEKVSNRTEEIKKIIIEQAENDESIDRARNLLAEKSASLESLKNARISLDVQIKDLESREESKRVEIGQMERKIRQFDDFSSQNLKLVEKIASSESKKSELENSIQQNELEQKDEQAHLVQINQHLKALEKANSELNDIFKEDDNFAVIPESKDSISYIRDLIDRKIDSQVKSDLSDIFSKAENLLLEKEAKKQKVREYLDALKAENQDGKSNEVLDEIKQSM